MGDAKYYVLLVSKNEPEKEVVIGRQEVVESVGEIRPILTRIPMLVTCSDEVELLVIKYRKENGRQQILGAVSLRIKLKEKPPFTEKLVVLGMPEFDLEVEHSEGAEDLKDFIEGEVKNLLGM